MDKKKDNKEVELKFEFDRLWPKKLSLVYRLLVPLLAEEEAVSRIQINDDEVKQ